MQKPGRPACRMYNSVPLNGGRAEYKFTSKDDARNVFEQGKRRVMLATLLADDAVFEARTRAVRHATNGPSGMQTIAISESLRIACNLKIQQVIDGRARQLTSERSDGLAACTTASSVAIQAAGRPACKRRAVRHADESNRRELSDERQAQ